MGQPTGNSRRWWRADDGRTALLLGALAMPGAGQAWQRRWWPCALHALAFMAAFGWFVWEWFCLVAACVRHWLHRPGAEAPGLAGLTPLLGPFLLCLGIYLLSLVDVLAAAHRLKTAANPPRPRRSVPRRPG